MDNPDDTDDTDAIHCGEAGAVGTPHRRSSVTSNALLVLRGRAGDGLLGSLGAAIARMPEGDRETIEKSFEDWVVEMEGEGVTRRAASTMDRCRVAILASGDPAELRTCLRLARAGGWDTPVLWVTDGVDPAEVLDPTSEGPTDFVCAPFRVGEVEARIRRVAGRASTGARVGGVEEMKAACGLREFVGESPALVRQLRRLPQIARAGMTVLLCGETGTGKELFARAIHHLSQRCGGSFVALNCGAVPRDLVENELFGHSAGAYTGANRAAKGLIQEAEGGTLFLDEIDCLPLGAQAALLRFLQEGELRTLGSGVTVRVDVRVLAATNARLLDAVEAGKFRRDLYYRLAGLTVELPPLRERREDIPLLVRHCVARFARRQGGTVAQFSPAALERLCSQPWLGNIRELENTVERLLVFAEGPVIRVADLELPGEDGGDATLPLKRLKAEAVTSVERGYVMRFLALHNGNISRAARSAGEPRRSFHRMIRKHGIRVVRQPDCATQPPMAI